MRRKVLLLVLVRGLMSVISSGAADVDLTKLPAPDTADIVFDRDIKPLLERSCASCHGPTKSKAHFRVDSREAIIRGGESHQEAVVPGNSAASPLVHNMAGLVKEMEMPPLDKRDKYPALTPHEIAMVRAWIDQGVKWPNGLNLNV